MALDLEDGRLRDVTADNDRLIVTELLCCKKEEPLCRGLLCLVGRTMAVAQLLGTFLQRLVWCDGDKDQMELCRRDRIATRAFSYEGVAAAAIVAEATAVPVA